MTSASARPLRIGIATDSLVERIVDGEVRIANGGVGVYIHQLISHLLELDAVNEYFLIRVGEGRLDIFRHPRARNVFLPKWRINRTAALLGTAFSRPARELKLDVIHFPNLFGGAAMRGAARQVVTVHDLTPLIVPATHPFSRVVTHRALLRWSLRKADRIIVPSNATERDLTERALVKPENIVCIPEGCNPLMKRIEPTTGFAARYGINKRFMLSVGVLEPRKNQALLLEVLRNLRKQGHDLELIIVGRPGWRWVDPLNTGKYRDLRGAVRILSDISDDDLVEFYNRAEMFIYPSLYEGFGLPLLEAMACGAPVIASNVSALPEVADEAALYADPHDAQAFTARALQLLSDSGLRKTKVEAGLKRARSFSWRATAASTLAVYEEVCRPRDSTGST